MFKGEGTFKDLVKDSNKVFEAFKVASVELPAAVESDTASLHIGSDAGGFGLVLDLADAPIFSLRNVKYDLPVADTEVNSKSATVKDGILYIDLDYEIT